MEIIAYLSQSCDINVLLVKCKGVSQGGVIVERYFLKKGQVSFAFW